MLVYLVLVPVLLGIFLQVFPLVKAGRVIAVIVQTALFGFAAYLFYLCRNGVIQQNVGGYEWQMGITLQAGTLSSSFILLTAFIFLAASVYSFNEENSRLLWFLLFVWEGLIIGVFLTRDLFNMFVLLEVITLTVAVMIMFKRDTRSMYDGILYLLVNIAAMQFFLFGAGYIYKLAGTFDIDAAAAALAGMDRSSLVLPFSLIMTGICLKCGLVPLHSWLPRAHGTPGSPPAVSAILSGLHVKTAIYLFISLQSLFGDIFITEFFLATGIVTGVAGFIFALAQTDIKLILAYHTISQIGLIIIGLCAGGPYSYTGALYHIFNHALFKSALFFCAGIIVKSYGTRDINGIRGVFRNMPAVGIAIIFAMLGITGAPFFNGSVSKYFISSGAGFLTEGAVTLINLGTIISFLKFSAILTGERRLTAPIHILNAHEPADDPLPRAPDKCSSAAALTLGVLCLAGGLLGEDSISFLFNVQPVIDAFAYWQKALFFISSLIAGYFVYRYYIKKSRLLKRVQSVDWGFRAICAMMGCFFAALLVVTGIFSGA